MRVATPTSGEGHCLLLTAPQAIVDEHMAQLAAPSAGTSASDEADVRRWFGHIDDELPDEGQMDLMDLKENPVYLDDQENMGLEGKKEWLLL